MVFDRWWLVAVLLLLVAVLGTLAVLRISRGDAWDLEAAWLVIAAGLAAVAWRVQR